jgi:hypothetical protein
MKNILVSGSGSDFEKHASLNDEYDNCPDGGVVIGDDRASVPLWYRLAEFSGRWLRIVEFWGCVNNKLVRREFWF